MLKLDKITHYFLCTEKPLMLAYTFHGCYTVINCCIIECQQFRRRSDFPVEEYGKEERLIIGSASLPLRATTSNCLLCLRLCRLFVWGESTSLSCEHTQTVKLADPKWIPDSHNPLVYYSSPALSILFIRFSDIRDRSGIRFVRSIYLGRFALYAPCRESSTNEHADRSVLS